MTQLALTRETLPATTPESLEKILAAEQRILAVEQCRWTIEHVLHAGMYARTARLDPNTVIVGALIRVPTILVVHGDCWVYAGDKWHEMNGYQVIKAPAGRKQVFVAVGPTEITMLFPTSAETVEAAENEFTEEAEKLHSRRVGG